MVVLDPSPSSSGSCLTSKNEESCSKSPMPQVVEALGRKGNYDMEIETYIRDMPKVELHVHLDGSFDPHVLFQYLQETRDYSCLPINSILPWDKSNWPVRQLVQDCDNLMQFHSLCTCRGQRSLQEMIKCFEIFVPIVRGNLALIEELAFDFCKRQAEQRVVYTECRYSPHLLAEGASLTSNVKVDPVPVLNAVTRGLRRGEDEYKITVNQILCCITWRPDWANDVVELAAQRKHEYPCAVVAVDIAAGEEHFDASTTYHADHLSAMQKAKQLGLNITIHAGEVGGGNNVREAIGKYGATRIGHAYQIVDDKELMIELREKNIHVETCPTSSHETGGWQFEGPKDWSHHPCVKMLENGISISFNSDDPAVFNTSLSWQYRTVIAKMKQPKELILTGILNGIDASFCSEVEKNRLRSLVEDFRQGKTVQNVVFRDRVIHCDLIGEDSI